MENGMENGLDGAMGGGRDLIAEVSPLVSSLHPQWTEGLGTATVVGGGRAKGLPSLTKLISNPLSLSRVWDIASRIHHAFFPSEGLTVARCASSRGLHHSSPR
jgi:hypothetical protein